MDARGHLARQSLLCFALLGSRLHQLVERLDLRPGQEREQSQVFPRVAIVHVDPVLIELVRRRARGIEPHRSRFGLAELRPARGRNQRHGQRVRGLSLDAPNQLQASGDVSPLIAAAHLERNSFAAVELQKIVCLQQHVRELSERDSAFDPRLHRILRQHVVDGEVLADIAHELHCLERTKPCGVVAHARGFGARKVEEALELLLDRARVRLDLLDRRERPFRRFPARVPDHACPAPNQRDGPVPRALEMRKSHHRHEMAQMQARSRRVEPHVCAHFTRCESVGQTVRVLVDHTAPGQLVQE